MKLPNFIVLICMVLIVSCSTSNEVVMPFRNISYASERLFPIETNDSKKVFRVWFNNGTSIDKVITVSSDLTHGNHANYTEFGFKVKKGLIKHKTEKIFTEKQITPKSGFESFFEIVDSLKLIDYTSQDSFGYTFDHQPFSLYVVEIKVNNRNNQFQFRTNFPDKEDKVEKKYELIENLIFDEFKNIP
ncbi:hypothetical protein ACE1ET_09535 [Saccharicrinis sp. FJH62]|uniref:hypothetical protein n=1 Tax=Saccharicrinis sp. FJH62 TaxID=3344657 RepID=UPI0035D474FF